MEGASRCERGDSNTHAHFGDRDLKAVPPRTDPVVTGRLVSAHLVSCP
jgi:hypothetical protein